MLFLSLVTLLASPFVQSSPQTTADKYSGQEPLSFVGVARGEAQRMVEARLNDGVVLRNPWIARERGLLDTPVTLGMFGTRGRELWRNFTDERRAEFGTIGVPRTDPAEKLEWTWIRGWLDAASILTRSRAMEQVDPLAYVRRVERTLAALVDAERPSMEERARELNEVLIAMPEYWEAARRSLVNPRRQFAEAALEALPELERWMRDIPAALQDMHWDPTFELFFDQHLRRALAETEAFRGSLEDTLMDMENYQGNLDRLRWESLTSSLTGRSVDAEKLHTRVLAETADLLMTLSAAKGDDLVDRDVLGAALVQGSQGGWERARAAGLFEGDIAIQLIPRWTAVRGGLTPPVHVGNPRNDSIEIHQAIGDGDQPSTHPGIHPWRRTVAGQRVLGVRHGAIGEAWLISHYVQQRPEGERLWNDFALGGLGLYATDWSLRLEGDKFHDDPDLLRASLECRIEEALLLLACIELHALDRTLGRVAESLAHRGGISRESAAYLAEQALRDPLSGLSFLAYETLRLWEAQSMQERSLPETLKRIYGTIAQHPTAHFNDLRLFGALDR